MYFKSQLEERVYNEIKKTFLKNFKIEKEVPWSKLFPNGPKYYNSKFVDFYFPQIKLVIEVNGIQHYQPTSFITDQVNKTLGIYHNQVKRDKILSNELEENDFFLISIPYSEEDIVSLIESRLGDLYDRTS